MLSNLSTIRFCSSIGGKGINKSLRLVLFKVLPFIADFLSPYFVIYGRILNKLKEVTKDLPLLKSQLKEIIADYKSSKINVKYDDIKFNAFAIKKYNKKDGVATITVQTSLEYYYRLEKGNKVIENYSDYKKQTRYTVEFIYVYDITQVKEYTRVIGIHCPNCGAPLTKLGNKTCDYCHTGLEDLNLKNWCMSSYREDY